MLISTKYDFVFLCMPKCASNSVEEMLKPFSDIFYLGRPEFRHTSISTYNSCVVPYLETTVGSLRLETVCLIREPISWLYSWYRFLSRKDLRAPSHPKHDKSTMGRTFEEFLEAFMSKERPPFAEIGQTQYDFVKNKYNKVAIDKIFVYENIDSFVEYMEQKVGTSLLLHKKNISPTYNYDSNIMEHIDYVLRKIREKVLTVKVTNTSKANIPELNDDLKSRLRKFLAEDFDLYEKVLSESYR